MGNSIFLTFPYFLVHLQFVFLDRSQTSRFREKSFNVALLKSTTGPTRTSLNIDCIIICFLHRVSRARPTMYRSAIDLFDGPDSSAGQSQANYTTAGSTRNAKL